MKLRESISPIYSAKPKKADEPSTRSTLKVLYREPLLIKRRNLHFTPSGCLTDIYDTPRLSCLFFIHICSIISSSYHVQYPFLFFPPKFLYLFPLCRLHLDLLSKTVISLSILSGVHRRIEGRVCIENVFVSNPFS